MAKKIVALLCVISMLFGIIPTFAESEDIVIHVSPNGNDYASGEVNAPLKTLLGAKTEISKLKKKYANTKKYTVVFHEGTYRFDSTVNFTSDDSGTQNNPITYKGADGEAVYFKGSKELDISKLRMLDDPSVLKRLPESARGKIGYLDLKAQGLTAADIPKIPEQANTFYDINFYLNGKEQTISQWPNGENKFAIFEVVSNGANAVGKGGTLRYQDFQPSKWTEAKDSYLGGYFTYDYIYYRHPVNYVDAEKKEITLKYGVINSTLSRRWKAFNLIEEIDMPGEWYVDRDSLIMYYYPEYSLMDATFEISTLNSNMIYLNGTDYINFENINFSQTRASAIQANNNSDYCVVNQCRFTDIGNMGVSHYGYGTSTSLRGDYDDVEPSAKHTINIGKGWTIQNNIFYNIGNVGVRVYGGNNDTFETGDNVIRNNYFNLNGTKSRGYSGADIYGSANVFENNLLHNSSQGVVNHSGNEHKIRYNEVNNVTTGSNDAGAFYTGRSIMTRRTDVSFNLIRNTTPNDPRIKEHNRGIYFDDGTAEQSAHHNIIAGTDKAISSGGLSCTYYANTVIDAINGFNINNWMSYEEQTAKYERWLNAVKNGMSQTAYDLWNEKYPFILEEAKQKGTTNMYVWRNSITDNFFVNSGNLIASYVKERESTVENNTWVDSFNDFVDPENYDYRIKKNSEILKTNNEILTEDFDINKIGIQFDEFDKEKLTTGRNFRQTYPQNGAYGVGTYKVDFSWQLAFGADKYRFVLATDRDFKNILIDAESSDNTYQVESLGSNYSVYYWKVFAINDTRQLKSTWPADGVTYVFTTDKFDSLNFDSLRSSIGNVEKDIPNIVEGTEAGTFKLGTLDRINSNLSIAKNALNFKKGTARQELINEIESKLNNSFSDEDIYGGYVNLGNYIKEKSDWNEIKTGGFELKDGEIVMSSKLAGTKDLPQISNVNVSNISKNVLFCFKMKVDYSIEDDAHWAAVAIRGEPFSRMWNQYNYFFVFKPKLIEFQIRSAGQTGIIKTFENNFIKNGQWHDVTFGAVNCGFGQLVLLIVDGQTVCSYFDDTAYQLRFKGGLTFLETADETLTVKAAEALLNNFDEVIYTAKKEGVYKRCKEFVSIAGEAMILAKDSYKYYFADEIKTISNGKPTFKDGVYYVPLSVIEGAFGENQQLKLSVKEIDGVSMVDTDDIKKYLKKDVLIYDEVIAISELVNIMPANFTYLFSIIRQGIQNISEF